LELEIREQAIILIKRVNCKLLIQLNMSSCFARLDPTAFLVKNLENPALADEGACAFVTPDSPASRISCRIPDGQSR
jgi:hypothetical protein